MKRKIKLTEATLRRIVERVTKEQLKEDANKELIKLFVELKKDPENQELKDKIKELTKTVGLSKSLTKKGADEINTPTTGTTS
jgi:hypothetical protein|tara:strand:- start:956 stop:1204 length:249 start_codon:yes stop_codon:yes gene_type:complete